MHEPKPAIWAPGIRQGHPLSVGLASLLPFWESSGGIVADLVKPDDALSMVNMDPATDWYPSFGRPTGAALNFDGSDDFLQGGQRTDLRIASNFTVMAYAGRTASPNRYDALVVNCDSTGLGWRLWTRSSSAWKWTFECYKAGPVSVQATATTEIPPQAHETIVGKSDGVNVQLYLEGALAATAAINADVAYGANSYYQVGAMPLNAGGDGRRFFPASVGMVAVWARDLGVGEIEALAADPFDVLRPRHRTYFLSAASAGAVPEEGGYYLYRGVGSPDQIAKESGDEVADFGPGSSGSVAGLGHAASTKHYYLLRPHRETGGVELITPDDACTVEFVTDAGGDWVGNRPAPVKALRADVEAGGVVSLDWRYRDQAATPASFSIWYDTDPDTLGSGAADASVAYDGERSYDKDFTLTDGLSYYFRVVAIQGDAESDPVDIGPYTADDTAPATPTVTVGTTW